MRTLTAGALLLALTAPVLADAGQGDRGPERAGQERRLDGPGQAPGAKAAPGRWRRGQVLPPEHRRAVIGDPHRHGLYAPPRGHAWVRVGRDVYLIALANGTIAEVLRDTH